MKKLLFLPLMILGSLTQANAQAPVTSGLETKNGPVMTFDALEYSFGNIKQGETATHEFKFKNSGKEPLIINNAVGSCGCTVPDYPKEPIKPKGTGTIKVTFNSTGKMGIQDKTVTLTYDTDKSIVLHIKGTVEAAPANPTPAETPGQNGGATISTTPAPQVMPTTLPETTKPKN
ncbi:MAG: DUF1573 domain-containing protein [Bacteroidetes bacterium]|jgi:hypothetical protein|nr:DUF1573 domain-containing protein [Bacteroidota bacterium]